ncbi:MAG TPA: serine/threonine-protein kinase [Polyangiaceae bacterium]|jgi:serine/threonine-protein kinase
MSERDESRKTPDLPQPATRQTETRLKSPPSEPPDMGDLDDPSMWDAPGLPEVVSMRPRLPPMLTDDDIVKAESVPPPGSGPVRTSSSPKNAPPNADAQTNANKSTLPNVESELKSKPGLRRLELVDQGDSLPPPTVGEINELVGQLVDGRYQVEKVVGVGSMGIVYVARHLTVGKRVALKVLRQHLLQDQEVGRRFAAEATAATAIGNAHIVDTLDYGMLPNGCAYLAMEFLEGQTVTEALRKHKALPLERLLRIGRQVAVALGAAHDAGIVHRDLKPDNIFLVDKNGAADFVKILDFGIAKFGGGQNKLTHAGAVFGTPHYMAPEQALGKPTDARTDLYALGVIMYEMAAGRVPFDGDNPISVLTQHATETPPPLSKRARGLPRRFDAMVMRCLAKEPADRFKSMAELVKEIDKVSAGVELPVITSDNEEAEASARALRPSRAKRAAVALLGVGLLAGIGYGASHLAAETAPKKAAASAAVKEAAPLPAFKEREPDAPTPGKDVALVLFPLDAHAVAEGKDLGPMPVSVKVPDGQTISVKIVRDGYYSRKVKLDGNKLRVSVILAKRDASKPPPPDALDDKSSGESPPEKDDSARNTERPPEQEKEVAPPKPAGSAE